MKLERAWRCRKEVEDSTLLASSHLPTILILSVYADFFFFIELGSIQIFFIDDGIQIFFYRTWRYIDFFSYRTWGIF